MPLHEIMEVELFDVWGIDVWDPSYPQIKTNTRKAMPAMLSQQLLSKRKWNPSVQNSQSHHINNKIEAVDSATTQTK